jgi:hypothetical protein
VSDTNFEIDEKFRHMIEKFKDHMIALHGFSFEEANAVVYGEIKREYDQRAKLRRANFQVTSG